MIKPTRRLVTLLLASCALPMAAQAAMWTEQGDAGGGTPSTGSAQIPNIGGPLDAIDGTIAPNTDIDLYRIRIIDPDNFSISLAIDCTPANPPPNCTPNNFDTLLWLFDGTGRGIVLNDDINSTDIRSGLLPEFFGDNGIPPLEVGDYLIAITVWGIAEGQSIATRAQTSGGASIFTTLTIPQLLPSVTYRPDLGIDEPLAEWVDAGVSSGGSYRLSMTGVVAAISAIPVPSTAVLMVPGILLMLKRRLWAVKNAGAR